MATDYKSHVANRIHPAYVPDAQKRELSLAFQAGYEVFRLDGTKEKRWVKPTAHEFLNAQQADWQRGLPLFDERVRRWVSVNVYADSIKQSAATPLDRSVVANGWNPKMERLIYGEDGGLDGQGYDIKAILQNVLIRKLFAGRDWLRAAVMEGRTVAMHEDADNVIWWRYDYAKGYVRLVEATVQGVSEDGHIMRTVYKLEEKGAPRVTWAEYKSDTAANWTHKVYAPENEDAMVLEFDRTPNETGVYAGLNAVPLICFQVDRSKPYRSDPPFKDAAAIQLTIDEKASHLEHYSLRKSASPVFVATGMGQDENGMPHRVTVSSAGISLPDGAAGTWEYLDTNHVPQERAEIDAGLREVRRMCLDPMRQVVAGDVKAAEVVRTDRRARTWLEMQVDADLASATRFLELVSSMEGLTNEPNPSLAYTKLVTEEERQAITDRFAQFAKDGLVSRPTFLEVAEEVDDDLTAEMWERIKQRETGLVETWTTAGTRVLSSPGEAPQEEPSEDAATEEPQDDGEEEEELSQ